jgi:hypothetical protein
MRIKKSWTDRVSLARSLDGRKLLFWGFLSVLAVYPYLFVLNMLLPWSFLGDNCVYIYAVTFFLIAVFALQIRTLLKDIPAMPLLILVLAAANSLVLNILFNGSFKHPDVLRIPFNLVVYAGVAYLFTAKDQERRLVYNVILWNCVIQAVIGIVHYSYFPYIKTGTGSSSMPFIIDMGDLTSQAERGLLLNPNIYSLFLLLGCFLIVFRDEEMRKKTFLEISCMLLLISGIVVSNSRFGLFCGIVLFIQYFRKSSVRIKLLLGSLAVIAVVASYGFLGERISHAYSRTLRQDGYAGHYLTRTTRNINALNLLIADWSNMLIGPSQKETVRFKIIEGKRYSDNSFFLLFHNYGLPAGIIMIMVMGFIYSRLADVRRKGARLFLAHVVFALYLYNSILFDIWLLYFSAVFMVMSRKRILK